MFDPITSLFNWIRNPIKKAVQTRKMYTDTTSGLINAIVEADKIDTRLYATNSDGKKVIGGFAGYWASTDGLEVIELHAIIPRKEGWTNGELTDLIYKFGGDKRVMVGDTGKEEKNSIYPFKKGLCDFNGKDYKLEKSFGSYSKSSDLDKSTELKLNNIFKLNYSKTGKLELSDVSANSIVDAYRFLESQEGKGINNAYIMCTRDYNNDAVMISEKPNLKGDNYLHLGIYIEDDGGVDFGQVKSIFKEFKKQGLDVENLEWTVESTNKEIAPRGSFSSSFGSSTYSEDDDDDFFPTVMIPIMAATIATM